MVELMKFIFTNGWTYAGTCFLLFIFFFGIALVVENARK